MVLVNCPWMQKDIIKEIEAVEYNGICVFKHIKTEGIRIFFDSKVVDEEKDIRKSMMIERDLIMEAIMKIPRWDTLAFNILPVINGSVIEGYKYTVGGYSEE